MYPHIKNAHFAIYFTSGSVFNFNGSQTVQCARTNSKTEIEEHEVLPLKISNMMSVRVASISVTQFIIWQNEGRRGYRNVNINSTLMVFNVAVASDRLLFIRSLHRNNGNKVSLHRANHSTRFPIHTGLSNFNLRVLRSLVHVNYAIFNA